jgi:hypothetical protein
MPTWNKYGILCVRQANDTLPLIIFTIIRRASEDIVLLEADSMLVEFLPNHLALQLFVFNTPTRDKGSLCRRTLGTAKLLDFQHKWNKLSSIKCKLLVSE